MDQTKNSGVRASLHRTIAGTEYVILVEFEVEIEFKNKVIKEKLSIIVKVVLIRSKVVLIRSNYAKIAKIQLISLFKCFRCRYRTARALTYRFVVV